MKAALLLVPLLLSACYVDGFYTPFSIPLGGPYSGPHPSSPQHRGPPVRSSQAESSSPRREAIPSLPFDGNVTESYSGNRTYREKQTGRIIGSESTSASGTTTYRDSSGRILGSSSESVTGTTTYRDSSGSISTTSSTREDGGGGKTTTYRRNGVIIGTQYVSPAGNTTWRNGNGSMIGGPSEMGP
jgi:hypothetical protein